MDKLKLFQIGEISKLFHISVSSIRHYEDIGLVKPEYIDPQTGYRYFSIRQFEVFNSIRYLRNLDMPLSEISDFLKNRDVEKIEEKLIKQKAVVAEKLRELEKTQRKIDNRLHRLREARESKLDEIVFQKSPAFKIFWIDERLSIDGYYDMEEPTIKLAKEQTNAMIFLGKVGVGISAEHLNKRNFDCYDGVFLLLDEEDIFEGKIERLPETDCVILRFCGSHVEAPQRYEKLLDYIETHNLKISGFSREITIIDYGITNDTEKFVTEISIPVTVL